MLGHFDLAEELTEGGSVACSVFTGDSDLSCALSHVEIKKVSIESAAMMNGMQREREIR